MELDISNMNLDDFYCIEDSLLSDFDNFWTPSIFKQELLSNNSFFLVAKYNKEIVGFAGFKVIFDEADIMNIVVKKSFRNMGVGSFLLNQLITLAKTKKLSKLNLEVNENNKFAISLYDKFNFTKVSTRKKYYNGKDNAILMEYPIL